MFGKPDGIPIAELKDGKHASVLSLKDLRSQLNRYLDDHAQLERFPRLDRPMDLKGLKVVALIQNDASGEVLQAAEFAVVGQEARKP